MPRFQGTICDLLGTEYPVIQGGMAWVSNASLAAAVSMAGGLGVIAAGNAPPEWVTEQVRKLRETTDRPFGLNIMLLSPFADQIAQIAAQERVPVVITGAGNPASHVKSWKEAGCIVAPVVASSALAVMMQRMGADMVIAEGCEAGGHIGELTTMVLTPDIVRSVDIPVVAAGGIFDAATVAAAFCLGAKGVQVGTRFILATECTAHTEYKRRIIRAKDIDSKVTGRVTGASGTAAAQPIVREMARIEYEENAVESWKHWGPGRCKARCLTATRKRGRSWPANAHACWTGNIGERDHRRAVRP